MTDFLYQAVYEPGNLGIVRDSGEPVKVREMSGNFHPSRHESRKRPV